MQIDTIVIKLPKETLGAWLSNFTTGLQLNKTLVKSGIALRVEKENH